VSASPGKAGDKQAVSTYWSGAVMATPSTALRRESATSLYQQLADHLRREIVGGRYKPHEMLPAESALSELYGVSRITVRQAMDHLVDLGMVKRKQGKGTFVTGPVVRHQLRELKGFIEGMNTQGIEPETHLLEFGLSAPSPRAAERLATGTAPLLRMRRLISLNGVPFAESEVHLQAEVGAKVSRDMAELLPSYVILDQFMNIKIARADLTIRAQAAGREHARLLKMPERAPLLAIERVSFSADEVPREHTYFWTRAENYEFSVSVYGNMPIAQALSKTV